jgi:hypothetical protein
MRLPRGGFLRSGSARLGRSQKDGLPFAAGKQALAVQGHQLAHIGRGSLVAAPSNREPRRATLLCSLACRSSAQETPGSPVILLAYGQHEDRTPFYGHEPTREAAMAAFAKSWRR